MFTRNNFSLKRVWLLLISGVLMLNAQPAQAQEGIKTKKQDMIWLYQIISHKWDSRWSTFLLLEERTFTDPWGSGHIVALLGQKYDSNKHWTVGAGFLYFGNRKKHGNEWLTVPEWRPHQEVIYKTKLGSKWGLQGRAKLEQRFTQKQSHGELLPEYSFRMRLRLRAGATYRFWQSQNTNTQLLAYASHESIWHTAGDFVDPFDQDRSKAGISFKTPKLTYSLGGMFFRLWRPSTHYEWRILQLGLVYKL